MGRGLTAGVRRDATCRCYFAAGVKPASSRTLDGDGVDGVAFGEGVGLVDDTGVSLTGGHLAAHVGDGLLLGNRVEGHAELLGEGLGELAAGDLGRADDQLGALERGVEARDARGVARRRDERQRIGDEDGLRVDLGGVGGLLHGGLVGGGQDVNVRAFTELGHEVLGAREVEAHVHAGVGGLEGLLELTEGLGQRGGGVDVEDGGLRGGLGRGRGRGVGGGGAGGAGGEGQGGRAEDGKDTKGAHSSLLLCGNETH